MPGERGAALLAFVMTIFVAASYWLLDGARANARRTEIERRTITSMALAKEALIGRAAVDVNRPGSLPCPDTNGDGAADLFVGSECPAYLGRLPWKTLDIPESLDANGDVLWYALSRGLRDATAAQPINPLKSLELSLDNTVNVAAIVFSAGLPLPGQSGRPNMSVADYLDASNADGDEHYVSGPPSPAFNDIALPISREELFRTVSRRVLGEIRGPDEAPGGPTFGLRAYFSGHSTFPLADTNFDGYGDAAGKGLLAFNEIELHASSAQPPYTWLSANGWLALISYRKTSVDTATIEVDGQTMIVRPCTTSPCSAIPRT